MKKNKNILCLTGALAALAVAGLGANTASADYSSFGLNKNIGTHSVLGAEEGDKHDCKGAGSCSGKEDEEGKDACSGKDGCSGMDGCSGKE